MHLRIKSIISLSGLINDMQIVIWNSLFVFPLQWNLTSIQQTPNYVDTKPAPEINIMYFPYL